MSTSVTQPALVSFARGVIATLAVWPALRIAVEEGWGGPESSQKRTWLASAIVDAFEEAANKNRAVPDVPYVEETLLQVLADEFDAVLEDGSAHPIAKSIVQLWQEIVDEGNVNAVARVEDLVEQSRGTKLVVNQADASDEECRWEDDENESESEDENADNPVPQLLNRSYDVIREEPEVDEDGFTMVNSRRKSRH